MKTNIIYTGDCCKVIKKSVAEKSIDLIFADPPYNLSGNGLKWEGNKTGGDWHMVNESWDKMTTNEYFDFTMNWINACDKVLKDKASIYIACSYHNVGEVMMVLKQLNYKINNIITWHKNNSMPNMTKRVFTHSTEFVVWAVKGSGWTFNYDEIKKINPDKQLDGAPKQMRDLWQLPLVQGKERIKNGNGRAVHPTQKPEEMLKRIVLASSNEGDLVLDPFLGSGTTAYIAQKYNRKWIGIDQSKEYTKIAAIRIKQLQNISRNNL